MSDENNPLLNAPSVSYQALNENIHGDDSELGTPGVVVPDMVTPMHQVYTHEITDVPVGSYAGVGDRSVLVPPPGFEQLDQEFQEALEREYAEDDVAVETRSLASVHFQDDAELLQDRDERVPVASQYHPPALTSHGQSHDTTFTFGDDLAAPIVAKSMTKSQRAASMGQRLSSSALDLSSLKERSSSSTLSPATFNDELVIARHDSDTQTVIHTRPGVSSNSIVERRNEDEEEDDDDMDGDDRPRGGGDATTIYPGRDPNTQRLRVGDETPIGATPTELSTKNSLNLPLPGQSPAPSAVDIKALAATHQAAADALDPYRALLKRGHKLGEWRATAICGNDATGSIFYMAGPCVTRAGVLAPLSVFIVTVVLYLFRAIYGEAVTALPLNGGAYNVLLNTTKKSTAAMAAVLTLLSYIATAVVSAAEAVHYLRRLVSFNDTVLLWATIGLLLAFAILNYVGIGESANVALGIFVIHLITLSLLLVVSVIELFKRGTSIAEANWNDGPYSSIAEGIYYGFSSAMLGVTGFETSANYVEEQKPGVYVKTLRNMWGLVSFFNITLSFCVVFLVDVTSKLDPHNASTIVADLARNVGGRWLEVVVAVDACLVLAGGVLTAYVGVIGLVRRLALDRCLPEFFLKRNEMRGTNHWIIFSFFLLCASMYVILNQNVQSLADTYSVAFMAVMALFALGVMMLKVKRSTLTAEVTTTWLGSFFGFVFVVSGLIGIILQRPEIVYVFALYFFAAWAVICVMFFRYQVLKLLYFFAQLCPFKCCSSRDGPVRKWIRNTMFEIRDRPMAFFAKRGKISVLNKAVQYVRENEDCSWLRIVHVFEKERDIPPTLYRNVHILNEQYPKMKIDLVLVKGKFTPPMVAYVSVKLGISRNHIFITTPQPGFAHKLDNLGGVRLITH